MAVLSYSLLSVGTAPISGPVVLLYLEIEFIVCPNASLYDRPYKTTSSSVARVKGSCLLQILVSGGSVLFFAVKDQHTLDHLVIMRDIFHRTQDRSEERRVVSLIQFNPSSAMNLSIVCSAPIATRTSAASPSSGVFGHAQ